MKLKEFVDNLPEGDYYKKQLDEALSKTGDK